MRRAGIAIAEAARRVAPEARRVVAFAGPGNNGGDAFAALAEMNRGIERVVYASQASRISEARADAEKRAKDAGVTKRDLPIDDSGLARAATAP